MTFCERCGNRYTKFDLVCPGCGEPVGRGTERGGESVQPKPSGSTSATDWLDDLEVLPEDMESPKRPKKELPHAHLQMVLNGEDEKLQVVLDPDPDNNFPKPVERRQEPVERLPDRDSSWFLTPDNGTRPAARTEKEPRPDRTPDTGPDTPRVGRHDHHIHRAHGLEWQKEAQLTFEAEDGYTGPGSIRHEKVPDDEPEWRIPSGKRGRRDDR